MAKNVTSYSGYRSADSYGFGGPKQKAAKKPSYKSGGMYSTGRAIAMAPQATNKSKKMSNMPKAVSVGSKKMSNMPASRKNVTSYGPRKSADAYGSPRKSSRAR
jgi:hypothetical protein